MNLKPEVSLTMNFNHEQLHALRALMGQMPFDMAVPLMEQFNEQLRAPHNQIEETERYDGDDASNT